MISSTVVSSTAPVPGPDVAGECRDLIKKPLVLFGALNMDPSILRIQNQAFLNQVPTLQSLKMLRQT